MDNEASLDMFSLYGKVIRCVCENKGTGSLYNGMLDRLSGQLGRCGQWVRVAWCGQWGLTDVEIGA